MKKIHKKLRKNLETSQTIRNYHQLFTWLWFCQCLEHYPKSSGKFPPWLNANLQTTVEWLQSTVCKLALQTWYVNVITLHLFREPIHRGIRTLAYLCPWLGNTRLNQLSDWLAFNHTSLQFWCFGEASY